MNDFLDFIYPIRKIKRNHPEIWNLYGEELKKIFFEMFAAGVVFAILVNVVLIFLIKAA